MVILRVLCEGYWRTKLVCNHTYHVPPGFMLTGSAEPSNILFSLQYTVTNHPPHSDSMDGVINLAPVGLGMVFEDEWVEEAMAVYEKVMGITEGFMKLSDAARMMLDEMEE